MPTRVQRVPETWPILHLESDVPAWTALSVDGLVSRPRRFSMDDLRTLGVIERNLPVHCVWGWSRTDPVWEGVAMDRLLEFVGPLGDHVTIRAASDSYSACLPIADAGRGMLAWSRDGEALAPEHGGPVRYLPPDSHWAYKGVKWAARVTVGDRFVAGFWESRVADAVGRIPADVELP
jgi:DMSO/TMAO reductase YedYZ molybdopterin-dependent catalytic subunit